ncbi:MAG TPA: MBL fold metallo-hydrolase, partial [Bdellovibrionota bacterium]|nr:MBL fold metallo-hydrolase [Bdellovibrionota bacterium]
AILLTHTHHDHVAGVPELVSRFPDAALRVHTGDSHRLSPELQRRARPVGDGEMIAIGELSIKALHTPGHSAGEISYLIQTRPPCLLTGDTVFIRDCGRTDFESGSNDQMFASLQKIKRLPPETIILPGHHYKPECASTLGRELVESPPFRCASVEELASLP